MIKYCFIIIIPVFLFASLSAQTVYMVRPSQANPLVTENDDSNYIYINTSVPQLNRLFIFFPGTGAAPKAYKEILKTAANMGYHAIGLSYNNSQTISSLCNGEPADCQGLARAEIFYGQGSSAVVAVDSTHCIRRRITDLLHYLDISYPSAGWGQFLTPQDSIDWSKICVSGHSQGAGMASVIAYWYNVYRAAFFASGGDWSGTVQDVADWMKQPSATPASAKYAFTHIHDELLWNNFDFTPVMWDTMGLYSFGSCLDVDTLTTDYYGAHCFTSSRTISGISPIRYHNSPVADINTPFNANTPVYQPLWQYMLGTVPLAALDAKAKTIISVSPNPAGSYARLQLGCTEAEITISNTLGQCVHKQHVRNYTSVLDLSPYPAGFYFITAVSAEGAGTVRVAIK